MPLCSFDSRSAMFDITPVENLFIEEYMRRAPGDYVKVYLYGLMDCYHGDDTASAASTLQEYAKALMLSPQEVEAAFAYWINLGLIERAGEMYCYHNLKHLLYNQPGDQRGKDLYHYSLFNQQLQQLFPQRMLQPQEYQMAYGWIDDLGLPQEVVLLLVQYSLQSADNGENVSFKYIDKVAVAWAKEHITSLEAAENYLQQRELRRSDTQKVLRHMGINRLPSRDEQELILKWRGWGFSVDAILAACREMTKIQQPNLNYLDKVLIHYHRLALHDTAQIQRYQLNSEQLQTLTQNVAHELGKREFTPEQQKLYTKWTVQWGFSHESVMLTAQGLRSFPALDRLLGDLHAQGCLTIAQIEAGLEERGRLDAQIHEMLTRCGQPGGVTEASRTLYRRWNTEWHMPHELILLAAEYAVVADNKLPFLQRILETWNSRNIHTVAAARAEHDRRAEAKPITPASGTMTKVVDAAKYSQREYDDAQFNALFENNPLLKNPAQ